MRKIELTNEPTEQDPDLVADVLYADQNIAIIDSIRSVSDMTEACLFNGFLVMYVKKGHAMLDIEDVKCEMLPGDLFVCTPRNIIDHAMLSMDFDVYGVFISPQFASQILRQTMLDVSAMLLQKTREVIHLDEEETRLFNLYRELAAMKLNAEESECKERSLNNLMLSAAYDIYNMFRKRSMEPAKQLAYNSAEQIFQNFCQMIHTPEKRCRTVNDYADRLNITPKYFSSICKQVSGKTASEIINEETVSEARILLRDPERSIKQIAGQLGFANQSHFGTFMRRHTGLSPQQLRK